MNLVLKMFKPWNVKNKDLTKDQSSTPRTQMSSITTRITTTFHIARTMSTLS